MPVLSRKSYPMEIKQISDEGYFSGYGSVFDVVDDWDDVIVRGAFAETLQSKTPVMLWQHDSAEPIGVYERVYEDEIGLWVEGRLLLDLEKGREAYILLKNRAIRGLSIGFLPIAWEDEMRNRKKIRVLKSIDLWEVSLVTFPANKKAVVDEIKTVRGFESFLRDLGYSKTEASTVLAALKSDSRRDADSEDAKKAALNLISKMRGV